MPPDKRPERRRAAPSNGGLISYGFDIVDQSRLAAGYVDRIRQRRFIVP
jgi:hypothetical protein